jgi:hypothetical protein
MVNSHALCDPKSSALRADGAAQLIVATKVPPRVATSRCPATLPTQAESVGEVSITAAAFNLVGHGRFRPTDPRSGAVSSCGRHSSSILSGPDRAD